MTNSKQAKTINPKTRATAWNVADKVVCFAPIGAVLGIQWNEYFATSNGLSNGIGLGLLGLFVALIVSKKTNFVKGAGGFVMIFAICFFLQSILNDLVLISGAVASGQVVSALWTNPKYEKWASTEDKTETAKINAEYMNKQTSGDSISGRC